MSRKAVVLISQNPEVKEVCERIQTRTAFMRKQLENLKKKMEEVANLADKENEPEWENLKDMLEELKLIDGYNDQTHSLSFSMEKNVVEMYEKGSENPMSEILRGLFQ